MDLGLSGKVAIVAASSKGLGKAVAMELAKEGAKVAVCARSEDVLEATAEEILAIKGEQAGLLIAQVDRLYIEGLRKTFDVQSEIEDRRGAFSEDPQTSLGLQGRSGLRSGVAVPVAGWAGSLLRRFASC